MSKQIADIRRITLRVPNQLHEALTQALSASFDLSPVLGAYWRKSAPGDGCGIIQGRVRDHTGTGAESYRDGRGIIQGRARDHTGTGAESCKDGRGIMQGRARDQDIISILTPSAFFLIQALSSGRQGK